MLRPGDNWRNIPISAVLFRLITTSRVAAEIIWPRNIFYEKNHPWRHKCQDVIGWQWKWVYCSEFTPFLNPAVSQNVIVRKGQKSDRTGSHHHMLNLQNTLQTLWWKKSFVIAIETATKSWYFHSSISVSAWLSHEDLGMTFEWRELAAHLNIRIDQQLSTYQLFSCLENPFFQLEFLIKIVGV